MMCLLSSLFFALKIIVSLKLLQDVIDEQEENQSDDELDKSGSEKKTAGKQSLVFILTRAFIFATVINFFAFNIGEKGTDEDIKRTKTLKERANEKQSESKV